MTPVNPPLQSAPPPSRPQGRPALKPNVSGLFCRLHRCPSSAGGAVVLGETRTSAPTAGSGADLCPPPTPSETRLDPGADTGGRGRDERREGGGLWDEENIYPGQGLVQYEVHWLCFVPLQLYFHFGEDGRCF